MRKAALMSAIALGAAPFAMAQQPGGASVNWPLDAPITHLRPGAAPFGPAKENPLANDPQATERGMRDFVNFNCVGCHAPNAGGGMGPSLSDDQWIYGNSPADIFLSIYQGRPNGMPAWGEALPEGTIWELVAYVQSLTEPAAKTFGKTISRTPQSPDKEQVPAENVQTANPWNFTEDFSIGQKPPGQ